MRTELDKELSYIKDKHIRDFVEQSLIMLPDYFFKIPSSSSGKYHPAYALGDGGLIRHTRAAVNIAYCMFENTTITGKFTPRHKDLIIAALILHDGLKSGYPKEDHTATAHPLLVCKFLKEKFDKTLPKDYDDVMVDVFPLIESHMGQWNGDGELPLPASGPARYVHMCDYLASRKLIEINFQAI